MAILMGPVLGFRGASDDRWQVSALVVSDGPPLAAHVGGRQLGAPVALLSHNNRTAWRYDLEVPRGHDDGTVRYEIGSTAAEFVVPGAGRAPRMAYASCNGFSDPKYMKGVAEKNERWTHMRTQHKDTSFHLLLLGGDQVYGDAIWAESEVPALWEWLQKEANRRVRLNFTRAMERQISRFYFDLYQKRWSQPEPAHMLARVPTLMMWDDHDVFDGWGSYPEPLQECEVYQGIFAHASRAFRAFQLQTEAGRTPPGCLSGQTAFSYAHRIGELALLALDLRSERTSQQVMSPGTWTGALDWVDALRGVRHLLVLLSIPAVYPRFGWLEAALRLTPGRQELEDDLRDHWTSRPHRGERLRMIHRLFRFARAQQCRVTFLSGDVHVGALGVLQSDRAGDSAVHADVINQLVSSAIVHPPPAAVVDFFLEHVGSRSEEIDRGITARMLEFPGTDERFIGARNWMALEVDVQNRIWANWHAEGQTGTTPYTKVIHPVGDPAES